MKDTLASKESDCLKEVSANERPQGGYYRQFAVAMAIRASSHKLKGFNEQHKCINKS